MDSARLRPEDRVFAIESDGIRWYRCVRCDSWLPLPPPENPKYDGPPERDEIDLPLRGRALRDKIVLRIIAVDRAIHFVVLALLAAAIFLFASHKLALRAFYFRVVNAVEGGSGAHTASSHGLLHSFEEIFTLRTQTLYLLAFGAAGYAALEGAEAVGLWFQKRWAEYLTFVANLVFMPYEGYELARSITVFKVGALAVNVAIAVYLLFAKRLFGIRGGAEGEERSRARDVGWEALERTAPPG
jgi:uncharacterized membrane protein (DUF2068 family)